MKKNILGIASLIIAIGISACGGNSPEAIKAKIEKLKAEKTSIDDKIATLEAELDSSGFVEENNFKNVNLSVLGPQTFVHYLEIQGEVTTDNNVMVSSRMPGLIQKVLVSEGNYVNKGTVLAELDAAILKSTLAELQTQYQLAKAVFDRQENLWKQKIGTEIQFLQAKANKDALLGKMTTIKDQIDQTLIKAPISGTVDMVNAKVGENAAPGVPAFRVVNTTDLRAKADISETYISSVKQGAEVILTLPDADKEIKTKITFASKVVDPLKRTFHIEAKIISDASIKPNMLVKFKIADYKKSNVIVIPINVVQTSDEGTYVWVMDEANAEKVMKKYIKVGKTYGKDAEITSGLKQGDKLIVAGYQNLNDGEQVNITKNVI